MKRICLLAFIVTMLWFGLDAQTVTFSQSGGFYENSFNLTLTCDEAYHIRYTINGNTPTASSPLYTNPLVLNENLYSNSNIYTIQISPDDLVFIPDSVSHCIVIRAAVFDSDDTRVGDVITNSYFINEIGCGTSDMAVVSICADSLDLFDFNTGIFVPGVNWDSSNPDLSGNYYQKGLEWERCVNVEFYEPDDNSGINQICGLRTHGNRARRYPSKGMKLYARADYGKKRFKHAFFGEDYIDDFKHLVLKPFASFWPYSGAQDYVCNKLAIQVGLPSSDCRPVIVYLNGEYWGLYFIQEKIDERFLEDHFGINHDECNIISNWKGETDHGNNTSFKQMMNWFKDADPTNSSEYQQACSLIDVDNFIDYYVFETFVGNWDWPGNNMRCWQIPNERWRWIFFDGDATIIAHDFDVFENAAVYTPPSTWINYPEAKLIFGKLLKNNQFLTAFKDRAYELCDGPFLYANTYSIFNGIIETMRPKINEQTHRFGYPEDMEFWDSGNAAINQFLENRVENYLTLIEESPLLDNIDEFMSDTDKFTCHPNPTNGKIFIYLYDNQLSTNNIKIYSILGNLVYDEPATPFIDLDLPAGIYLLRIGNSTKRIIIYDN